MELTTESALGPWLNANTPGTIFAWPQTPLVSFATNAWHGHPPENVPPATQNPGPVQVNASTSGAFEILTAVCQTPFVSCAAKACDSPFLSSKLPAASHQPGLVQETNCATLKPKGLVAG